MLYPLYLEDSAAQLLKWNFLKDESDWFSNGLPYFIPSSVRFGLWIVNWINSKRIWDFSDLSRWFEGVLPKVHWNVLLVPKRQTSPAIGPNGDFVLLLAWPSSCLTKKVCSVRVHSHLLYVPTATAFILFAKSLLNRLNLALSWKRTWFPGKTWNRFKHIYIYIYTVYSYIIAYIILFKKYLVFSEVSIQGPRLLGWSVSRHNKAVPHALAVFVADIFVEPSLFNPPWACHVTEPLISFWVLCRSSIWSHSDSSTTSDWGATVQLSIVVTTTVPRRGTSEKLNITMFWIGFYLRSALYLLVLKVLHGLRCLLHVGFWWFLWRTGAPTPVALNGSVAHMPLMWHGRRCWTDESIRHSKRQWIPMKTWETCCAAEHSHSKINSSTRRRIKPFLQFDQFDSSRLDGRANQTQRERDGPDGHCESRHCSRPTRRIIVARQKTEKVELKLGVGKHLFGSLLWHHSR